MIWYKENKPDIIVSTRVRLARNLENIPFPNALKDKTVTIKKIRDAVFSSNSTLAQDFDDLNYDSMTDTEKIKLLEEHLISNEMLQKSSHDVLLNKDKTMSLMIMEEDHIRMQVIMAGYCLDEAYSLCSKVDDVLSESLNYAFDEKLGYLTSCPTNLGTALRASVMLHLPGLSILGRISKVIESANNIGITVRGFTGEGSKATGDFYQISNQVTLGITEEEIINRVKNVTDQIVSLEKAARKQLLEHNNTELSDKIYRSYGTLKYARSISSKEAISLLSDVLLGINMGIIKESIEYPIMECITKISPAHMSEGDKNSSASRDKKRADFIRNIL